MKILNAAAIAVLVATAALGSAQGRPQMGRPPMGGPGGPGGGMGRGRDPREQADRQTQMMTQMLGLNPMQQKKVHDILFKAAVEAKRIREAQTASFRKVLTVDQMKKMESMRGRGGGGGMRRGG